jgi:H+-transporting ATPase
LDELTRAGHRTIAVAAGPRDALELIGFIAFSDPPRADSAELLTELRSLGVLPVMITGDAVATAATIAREIGLPGPVCPAKRHSRKVQAERLRRLCRDLS